MSLRSTVVNGLLEPLAVDPDWLVRWTVAGRAEGAPLTRLLNDEEDDVRARAVQRWTELNAPGGWVQDDRITPIDPSDFDTQAGHG